MYVSVSLFTPYRARAKIGSYVSSHSRQRRGEISWKSHAGKGTVDSNNFSSSGQNCKTGLSRWASSLQDMHKRLVYMKSSFSWLTILAQKDVCTNCQVTEEQEATKLGRACKADLTEYLYWHRLLDSPPPTSPIWDKRSLWGQTNRWTLMVCAMYAWPVCTSLLKNVRGVQESTSFKTGA